MKRIIQAWDTPKYIGIKVEDGVTVYLHKGYVHYHFKISDLGRQRAEVRAKAWAVEIGGTVEEYQKEGVFVVKDESNVGRTKTGREKPNRKTANTSV